MRESELLAHIKARSRDLPTLFPHILVGPGDDCAVIAPGLIGNTSPNQPAANTPQLLLKVDQLIEHRHFRPPPATPIDLIARKSIARAVSDIAAAGGSPLCALAAAALPPRCTYSNQLFDSMAAWARYWKCPLVGGDISALAPIARGEAPPLVLSITVIGTPHPTRGPVLRSGARPGDALYVTGPLGGSLDRATGLGRHLTFEPRLAEAAHLCDSLGGDLHAMMDISDGLGRDAARMAESSSVRIEISALDIPLSPAIGDWHAALADGEDYELLFATAPGAKPTLPDGRPCFCIGRVVAGSGCVAIEPTGTTDISTLGWDHQT